ADRNRLQERHDHLAWEVGQLKEAVAELRAWVFALQPDLLEPPADVRRELTDLIAGHGLDAARADLTVSKNDVMFQYHVAALTRRGEGVDGVFAKYLRSGLHTFQ